MFARIATTESEPERLDEIMCRLQEQTVPVLKDQKGFRRAFGMIDRTNGKPWLSRSGKRRKTNRQASPLWLKREIRRCIKLV